MPNHITQQLHIKADDETISKIRRRVCSEDETFDARRVVFRPVELDIEHNISSLEENEKATQNLKKYGHKTWYKWSIKNWGTKWGTYRSSWLGNNIVAFESAWSASFKIIQILSEDFPEAVFTLEYSDEGGGEGIFVINNGDIVFDESYEYDSEESINMRKKLGTYYHEEE